MIFSIIIPVFNAGEKLGKTLDSIIKQKNGLYEIIIVDGKSTDGTHQIIEHYSKICNDIKCISEPDQGIYDAMNKGIGMASGAYFYFIGAGDVLRKDILETVVSKLSFSNELVYGNVFHKGLNRIFNGEYDIAKIINFSICHQAIFYHREVFRTIGTYNLRYKLRGDSEFNLRCFGSEKIKTRFINEIIADFEGYGFSSKATDEPYFLDKPGLILKYFGEMYYQYYIYSSRYFFDFLRDTQDKTLVLYGNDDRSVAKICEIITANNEKNSNNIRLLTAHFDRNWDSDDDERLHDDPSIDQIINVSIPKKIEDPLRAKKVIFCQPFICNYQLYHYLSTNTNKEVALFGTGPLGAYVHKYIEAMSEKFCRRITVKFFLDNRLQQQDQLYHGKQVVIPNRDNLAIVDCVVIASPDYEDIRQQLLGLGLSGERIVYSTVYLENIHENAANGQLMIEKGQRYLLYGTGSLSQKLSRQILAKGGLIEFYADSNPKFWGKSFMERAVIAPEEILKVRDKFDKIIIASSFRREIFETLTDLGFEAHQDIL
jgi:glycosyltransferase involved in cell wall biosynthesis